MQEDRYKEVRGKDRNENATELLEGHEELKVLVVELASVVTDQMSRAYEDGNTFAVRSYAQTARTLTQLAVEMQYLKV